MPGNFSKPSPLCTPMPALSAQCLACAHKCIIKNGQRGICAVRSNEGGNIIPPYGYVTALNVDPVEKKPLFHFLPGAKTLSFGMAGCNFSCKFCQNWEISQCFKDKSIPPPQTYPISPGEIIKKAEQNDCRIICSTYNEPFVSCEWAKDVFTVGKGRFYNVFVSNGFASGESIDFISPCLDACNIDLKCFNAENHKRATDAELEPVKRAIKKLYELGIWLEITTLLIPKFNDKREEIISLAQFIADISPNIPLHITAFHADYKMADIPNTTPDAVLAAVSAAKTAGLNFVYGGNIAAGEHENTYCPVCTTLLIERRGFSVMKNKINNGKCPQCFAKIPGVWK